MAEFLLRRRLGPDSRWTVGSAGLAAIPGLPASEAAIAVMDEIGIDLRRHRSRLLDGELIDAASLVVVMTAEQQEQLKAMAAGSLEKTFLLTSFNASGNRKDIQDPIGLSLHAYRAVRDEIEAALPGLVDFMNGLELE